MIYSKLKRCLKFEVMVSPSLKGKKPNNKKMGIFNNIGNFGKKLSEFNEERRDKNLEKLRTKAQNAEKDNQRLEEEKLLRKTIEKHNQLKKEVNEQKTAKVRGVIDKLNQLGDKFEKKSKEGKFDVLGNKKSKEKSPQLFGNNENSKFKF